jgi:chemotaxis response regulator CheB
MPKVAIERGFAQRVVELDAMAATLQAQCGRGGAQVARAAGKN